MPIDQSRMLKLISAGEDLLQALGAAEEIVRRERGLAKRGEQTSEEALENIGLFIRVELLLREPLQSPLAVKLERAHFSPMRLGANRRAQTRRERRAAGEAREGLIQLQEPDDE